MHESSLGSWYCIGFLVLAAEIRTFNGLTVSWSTSISDSADLVEVLWDGKPLPERLDTLASTGFWEDWESSV